MSRGKGDPAIKGKKVDIPKENPELVELRAYQNCLYFLSQCNVQLKDPAVVYQTANALAEVYGVLVPKVKELAEKNGINLEAFKNNDNKAKTKKEKK